MKLSLVVPVYNEEENLPLLFDAIHKVMDALDHAWELILVDDGSRDNSLAVLNELVVKDPQHVRVVVFRRNFGQTAAIAAGIDHAKGEIVILLDADMQNDPADIPMLAGKIGRRLRCGFRLAEGPQGYLSHPDPSIQCRELADLNGNRCSSCTTMAARSRPTGAML